MLGCLGRPLGDGGLGRAARCGRVAVALDPPRVDCVLVEILQLDALPEVLALAELARRRQHGAVDRAVDRRVPVRALVCIEAVRVASRLRLGLPRFADRMLRRRGLLLLDRERGAWWPRRLRNPGRRGRSTDTGVAAAAAAAAAAAVVVSALRGVHGD